MPDDPVGLDLATPDAAARRPLRSDRDVLTLGRGYLEELAFDSPRLTRPLAMLQAEAAAQHAEPVAVTPESSIGAALKDERVRRGLTLAECESDLHIRAKFLAAIEDDRDEGLPEPSYARVFARTYANYLRLDVVALTREVDRRSGDTGWRDHEMVDAAPMDVGRLGMLGLRVATWSRSARVRTGRTALAVAIAVAVLIWLGYRADSQPVPVRIAPASLGPANISPAPAAPAVPTRPANVRRPARTASTRMP
jgi:hypothetical protein